jgi:hypothetical protein
MSKKVVFILPTSNIAEYLFNRTLYKLAPLGINPPPFEWYLSFCKTLTHDIMNRRMAWSKANSQSYSSDEMVDQVCQYLDVSVDASRQVSSALIGILGETEAQLQQYINMHVPTSSWCVWIIKDFFNDVIIEEGEDFRILEYNRMMDEKSLLEKRMHEEGRGSEIGR